MDLGYHQQNTSDLEGYLFSHPSLAIPYVCIMTVTMVAGTTGNILVIGAVLISRKVIVILWGSDS